MTTLTIYNDKVTSTTIVFENSAGQFTSVPTGDTLSVESSSASLGAAIGGSSSAPLVVLTPKVQAGTGYTVTVTDLFGFTATATVNIAADPSLPAQMLIGTATTTTSQSIPTAPGP